MRRIALTLLLLAGCATARPAPLPAPAPPPPAPAPPPKLPEDPRTKLLREADEAFEKRDELPQLRQALALWTKAVEEKDDAELRVKLARARHFLGRALPRDPDKAEERKAAFSEGAAEAGKALVLLGLGAPDDCKAVNAKAHVAAAFWRADNLAALSRELGIVDGEKARREAMCLSEQLQGLDATYFYDSPKRLFATLLARQPALGGGDLERSRKLFEEALNEHPEFLTNRLAYATSYAVKKQDRKLFHEQLSSVVVAPTEIVPEIAPENRLARETARAWLAREAQLFGQ